jgi:hypothetical protein
MGRVSPSQPVRTEPLPVGAPAVSPGPTRFPTEGACEAPRYSGQNVRIFARSTTSHPALARHASESARSLPQAAGDHAGELCLSPVGLTLVPRIAPVSMAAMLMECGFELRGQSAGWLAGGGCWNPRNAVRCRHIARGRGATARSRVGCAVGCTAGDSRLGTISQRSL